MVETKPYRTPEINELNNLTEKNKEQSPKSNKYRGKKILTKYQGPKPKSDTKFKGQCSDLEGYILDLEPRALDKFARKMMGMERYLGATSSKICQ